jgi:putative GTP pyrophosphokinase
MEKIHPLLIKVFAAEGYVIEGKPEAKTWDLEYEQMFAKLGLDVNRNESLYTSVHYVIKQNSTTRRLCELQVRTLAEEVWGEISHTINYPHPTASVACKVRSNLRFWRGRWAFVPDWLTQSSNRTTTTRANSQPS